MTTIKILIIILTIILLINSCVLLNCFNIRGKKVIKLTKLKERRRIFWYVLLFFWIILFILQLIKNIKYDHINLDVMLNMVNHIFFIIGAFYNTLEVKLSNTITEKGIYIDSVFFRWKKIESYRWVNENIIEFRIKTIKKYKNKKLEVDLDVNRTEVDKILKKYVKENKEEVVSL